MMKKNRQKTNGFPLKPLLACAIILVLIAFLSCAIYPSMRNRFFGLSLKPTGDIPLHQITYYSQKDPQWRDQKIGASNSTIGKEGCLITCVAVAVSDLTGEEVTPEQFNEIMTPVEGYEGASLIWYKINEAIPSIDYSYTREFSRTIIETDLQNGLMPIVKVKIPISRIDHWVMILGASDGQFMVFDPLNDELQPVPLSKYGRVYAYRVITKQP